MKIDKLALRRICQLLTFFFKLKHIYPEIPANLIEQVKFHDESPNNCIAHYFKNRLCISDKYILSFCCKIFNELPNNIRNECNLTKFKKLFNEYMKL